MDVSTYYGVVIASVYLLKGVRDLVVVDKERLPKAEANIISILFLALLVQAMVAVHAEHRPVNIPDVYTSTPGS